MSPPNVQNLGTSHIATAWQAQVTDSEKLGSLKSLFESKERSVESFINAKESFREAFMSEISQVAGSLPEGAVGPFLDKAMRPSTRFSPALLARRSNPSWIPVANIRRRLSARR